MPPSSSAVISPEIHIRELTCHRQMFDAMGKLTVAVFILGGLMLVCDRTSCLLFLCVCGKTYEHGEHMLEIGNLLFG